MVYGDKAQDKRLDRKFEVYRNYVVTYYDNVRRRSKPCIQLVELARQTIPECAEEFTEQTSVKEAV